jgi:hypothetical protein
MNRLRTQALWALAGLFSVFFIGLRLEASPDYVPQSLLTASLKGEARFQKGGAFAYSEAHSFEFKEGHLQSISTEYRGGVTVANVRVPADELGPLIAKMNHEFKAPGFLPDYSYEDLRNKVENRLTVDRDAGKVVLYRKAEGKEKTETLKLKEGMATGQGVFFWVVANLDEILKGQKVYTKFVVPALLDEFSFHAQLVKTDGVRHTIRVALDNWFFNMFASKLEFDIDAKTKALLEYRGTSNVADAEGKYRDVVITYAAR